MANITELVPGRRYLVNPETFRADHKNAIFTFLGIDNDTSKMTYPEEFIDDYCDCYWFYNSVTEKKEYWFLSKNQESFEKWFLKEIDFLLDV